MGLETHFPIFRPLGLVTQFPNPNKPKYTIPTNIRYLTICRNTDLNNRNNSDTIIHISALTICVVICYLKYFIGLKFTFDSSPYNNIIINIDINNNNTKIILAGNSEIIIL